MVVIVFPIINFSWVKDCLAGPLHLTLDDLDAIEDMKSLSTRYISIPCDRAFGTGLGIGVKKMNGEKNGTKFLGIRLKNHSLIIEVEGHFQDNQVTGLLTKKSSIRHTVTVEALNKIQANPALPNQFDFILNGQNHIIEAYVSVCFYCFLIFVILLIFHLRRKDTKKIKKLEDEYFEPSVGNLT